MRWKWCARAFSGPRRQTAPEQLKLLAIPKHYWWDGAVEQYIQDHPRVRKMRERLL
jgi:hypothetical protein